MQADGFAHDAVGVVELAERLCIDGVVLVVVLREYGVRFCPQAAPDARFEGGAPQHPCERCGRGVVPRADEGDVPAS